MSLALILGVGVIALAIDLYSRAERLRLDKLAQDQRAQHHDEWRAIVVDGVDQLTRAMIRKRRKRRKRRTFGSDLTYAPIEADALREAVSDVVVRFDAIRHHATDQTILLGEATDELVRALAAYRKDSHA